MTPRDRKRLLDSIYKATTRILERLAETEGEENEVLDNIFGYLEMIRDEIRQAQKEPQSTAMLGGRDKTFRFQYNRREAKKQDDSLRADPNTRPVPRGCGSGV